RARTATRSRLSRGSKAAASHIPRRIHSRSEGMGKKQVRQVRQQMRKVQPKAAASNAQGATRKQRERFVQAGGMLQGYSPDYVIRIGYISYAVFCLKKKIAKEAPCRNRQGR